MFKINYYYFIIIFYILFTKLYSEDFINIIYFKDGNILYANIIEYIPKKYIKVKTNNKGILIINLDEIEKIYCCFRQKQYKNFVEIGSFIGKGDYGMSKFNVNTVRFITKNIGIGSGLRYYYNLNNLSLSLLLNFKYTVGNNNRNNNRSYPFFSIYIGYSFYVNNRFSELGPVFNPNIGLVFKICNNTLMIISLGYEGQIIKYKHYFPSYSTFKNSGSLGFRVGFMM